MRRPKISPETRALRMLTRASDSDEMSREKLLAPVGRWTAYRRFRLLEAVRRGIVTREEVFASHGIDAEEWAIWELERAFAPVATVEACA